VAVGEGVAVGTTVPVGTGVWVVTGVGVGVPTGVAVGVPTGVAVGVAVATASVQLGELDLLDEITVVPSELTANTIRIPPWATVNPSVIVIVNG
jgi:hypothetical protein